jgi:predicted O-methyltransferase YrrM
MVIIPCSNRAQNPERPDQGDAIMSFLDKIRHPRNTWRILRHDLRVGSRIRQIDQTEFMSGLSDSAWLLYGMARALKPKVCVEIGSARGRSACFVGLALSANGGGKLFAIDPHTKTDWNDSNSVETFEIMRANLESLKLTPYVEIVRKTSAAAAENWTDPIDMLFIDGDHSYEGVRRDWNLFSPHLSPFGVVVFHDTIWDVDKDSWKEYRREDMGVPRFVEDLRREGYPIITFPNDCGVSLVQARIGGVPLSSVSTDAEVAIRR